MNQILFLTLGPFCGIRHLQSVLLFLALVVNIIARISVSVAIIAMTDADATSSDFPVSTTASIVIMAL